MILGPTTPTVAFDLGAEINDPLTMYANDLLTTPVNLAGLPGISVPCGLAENGRPIGLQLIGKPFDEKTLYRVAHQYETQFNLHDQYQNYKEWQSMHFETIIGLEVHVELKTDSKMFSNAPVAYGAEPNTNTSVIDLAYPGVLPTVNRRAVDWSMRAAMALNMEIATESKFDRKTISIQTTRKLIKFHN